MAKAFTTRRGVDAVLYFEVTDTATGDAVPTTALSIIVDNDTSSSRDEVDTSCRFDGRNGSTESGKETNTLSFSIVDRVYTDGSASPFSTALDELEDAWDDDLTILAAALDAATPDGRGVLGFYTITKFDRSEPLGDKITYSIEMKMKQRIKRISPTFTP